eukprot:gene32060-16593_t
MGKCWARGIPLSLLRLVLVDLHIVKTCCPTLNPHLPIVRDVQHSGCLPASTLGQNRAPYSLAKQTRKRKAPASASPTSATGLVCIPGRENPHSTPPLCPGTALFDLDALKPSPAPKGFQDSIPSPARKAASDLVANVNQTPDMVYQRSPADPSPAQEFMDAAVVRPASRKNTLEEGPFCVHRCLMDALDATVVEPASAAGLPLSRVGVAPPEGPEEDKPCVEKPTCGAVASVSVEGNAAADQPQSYIPGLSSNPPYLVPPASKCQRPVQEEQQEGGCLSESDSAPASSMEPTTAPVAAPKEAKIVAAAGSLSRKGSGDKMVEAAQAVLSVPVSSNAMSGEPSQPVQQCKTYSSLQYLGAVQAVQSTTQAVQSTAQAGQSVPQA